MFLLLLIKSQFCNSADAQPYDSDQEASFFLKILAFDITLFDVAYTHYLVDSHIRVLDVMI